MQIFLRQDIIILEKFLINIKNFYDTFLETILFIYNKIHFYYEIL